MGETGARNQRRACGVICNRNSSFEIVHGLLDHIMYKLNVRSKVEIKEQAERGEKKEWKGKVYELVHAEEPDFLKGMCGHIVVDGLKIGVAGVPRPDVLDPPAEYVGEGDKRVKIQAPWSVKAPCSVVEF